jgi:methyl-accepting chemotaxis protein
MVSMVGMNTLKNMTIGRRIFLSLGGILLILAIQGLFSMSSLNTANEQFTEIEHNSFPSAVLLGKINTNVGDFSADQLRYVLATDQAEKEGLAEDLEEVEGFIKGYQEAYEPLLATVEEKAIYKVFESKWNEYLAIHHELVQSAATLSSQNPVIQKLFADLDVLFDDMTEDLTKLVQLNEDQAAQAVKKAEASFALTRKVIYLGILFALLIGAVGGLYMKAGASKISGVVKSSVEQLIKLSLALSASTQQASAGAQQNAAIAQQVAAGATQQSRQAEDVSKALAQMSQVVSGIATTSEEVSSATTEASKLAQQTGESTEKISKMAAVVNTTAEQTNLLALNAAIEAARAGEAGRGFAVVADEVRKLADSSSQAVSEVQQIVKEIASNISTTVESISKSSLKIGDVAAGINQQSDAITQIARTMDSIAAVAQQSASGAQQLSASTQQTSAATQQVAAASTDLQQLADRLQKLVGGKIKVSVDTPAPTTPAITRPTPPAFHAVPADERLDAGPPARSAVSIDIITPKESPHHETPLEEHKPANPERHADEPQQ